MLSYHQQYEDTNHDGHLLLVKSRDLHYKQVTRVNDSIVLLQRSTTACNMSHDSIVLLQRSPTACNIAILHTVVNISIFTTIIVTGTLSEWFRVKKESDKVVFFLCTWSTS